MSSSNSNTVEFFPTSPTPPSRMARSALAGTLQHLVALSADRPARVGPGRCHVSNESSHLIEPAVGGEFKKVVKALLEFHTAPDSVHARRVPGMANSTLLAEQPWAAALAAALKTAVPTRRMELLA